MARYEDVTAATPLCEAEIVRLLTPASASHETLWANPAGAAARPVAQWEIDPRSNRPVCRWVLTA
jgi:hypothetical protein